MSAPRQNVKNMKGSECPFMLHYVQQHVSNCVCYVAFSLKMSRQINKELKLTMKL